MGRPKFDPRVAAREVSWRRYLEDRNLDLETAVAWEREARKIERAHAKGPLKVLAIGDPHATPGVPNERFLWAGKLAADEGVDLVVNLGDHWDADSLCSYDQGKKGFDSRRLQVDVEVGQDGLDLIDQGLGSHAPGKILCLGNHEYRLQRVVTFEPRLEGIVGTHMLEAEKWGWKVVPYMQDVKIAGMAFTHVPFRPNGREVTGVTPSRMALKDTHVSCCFGHTHRRAVYQEGQLLAVNAGCYFPQHAAYASPRQNEGWWRGLTVLSNLKGGMCDPQFYSLDVLKRRYG